LSSTAGTKLISKQERNMVKLPSFILGVIGGVLLSDGWLQLQSKNRSINACLHFKQSLAHSQYVWFVYNIISHYCSSYPFLTSGTRAGVRFYGLEFFTRCLPCITELYPLFYIESKKVIPHNIYELLTPAALAHLIMGDGTALPQGLIICTNSFSLPDIVRLMNVLMTRYSLECSIHIKRRPSQKIEYLIYIKECSMPHLRSIVAPYFHSSMVYKINGKIGRR
jgi:hypothetical protein